MFHDKGSMKEIEIANGVLTLVCTFNLLELSTQERELVFTLVDMINKFEKDRSEKSLAIMTDMHRHYLPSERKTRP